MSCGRIKKQEKFITPCRADALARFVRIPRERDRYFFRAQPLPMQTHTCSFHLGQRISSHRSLLSISPKPTSLLLQILCWICYRIYSFWIKVNKAAWALKLRYFLRAIRSWMGEDKSMNGCTVVWCNYRCIVGE